VSTPRAIVVGGGIYGWGCALRMAELGSSVTVIDPRSLDDSNRASGGVTRLLRLEYGDAGVYSELTLRARARWREIEQLTRADLYREVGVLFLVPDGDDGAWERASLDTLRALEVAGHELGVAAIVDRWPSVRPEGIAWGVANPVGGFLWAHRATLTVAGLARQAGARLLHEHVVASDGGGVVLSSGERRDADIVVLATGAWSAPLVGDIPIRPTRQVTAYLAGGPADVPVFADGAPFSMYGVPAHDGLGLKIGSHVTGPEADPDAPAERVATVADLRPIREFAARRFGMAGAAAEIVRADVCFYAMTPTENPVIDRLDDARVICAGFSGHGFKFAPVLSAAVAEFALGRIPSVDLTPFRLPPTP
jgi:glycine/D-amino acid oxidase-like deaminating enzyme